MFALITQRPDYNWPFPIRSYFTRISLHGLPASLVDELAESALCKSDLPPALKRVIAQRSDVNPFFALRVLDRVKDWQGSSEGSLEKLRSLDT